VTRSIAEGRHHVFRLVFHSPDYVNARKALIDSLKLHFAQNHTLDAVTQLPDSASLTHYLSLAQQFSTQHALNACFVYMHIEKAADVPTPEWERILSHIGHVISRNLRADDTVGRAGEDALGMVLIDVNQTTIHLALNRIHHMMLSDPYTDSHGVAYAPKARQAAMMLAKGHDAQEMMERCMAVLQEDTQRDMVLFEAP
jgi:GGDEF domain-containing protein